MGRYRLSHDRRPDGQWRVRIVGPDGNRIAGWQFINKDKAICTRAGEKRISDLIRSSSSPVPFASMKAPENGSVITTDPVVVITEPNLLVLSDLHVPHHNREMLKRAVYVTLTHFPSVRQVAIIGDVFDFSGLSRHPHNSPEEAINEELRIGGDVLRWLFNHFDTAYICNGNHDERLARKIDAHLSLQFLIDGALGGKRPGSELIVTNLDYFHIDPDDMTQSRWIIGHPSGYSGQGGKTPSDIADVVQRNVMTGHNHVIGQAQSRSGKYIGIDIGHCTEPNRHYYQRRRLTKYHRWNAGFSIIQNGFAHVFTEQFTDWASLGC